MPRTPNSRRPRRISSRSSRPPNSTTSRKWRRPFASTGSQPVPCSGCCDRATTSSSTFPFSARKRGRRTIRHPAAVRSAMVYWAALASTSVSASARRWSTCRLVEASFDRCAERPDGPLGVPRAKRSRCRFDRSSRRAAIASGRAGRRAMARCRVVDAPTSLVDHSSARPRRVSRSPRSCLAPRGRSDSSANSRRRSVSRSSQCRRSVPGVGGTLQRSLPRCAAPAVLSRSACDGVETP